MTKYTYINGLLNREKEMAIGTEKLNQNNNEHNKTLHNYLKTTEWYKRHETIMSLECEEYKHDILFILRKHLFHLEDKISKLLNKYSSRVSLHFTAKNLIKQFIPELEKIMERTVVFDFRIVNKGKKFNEYLDLLKDNQIEIFYKKYPELSRILSIRLGQILDNLESMLANINNYDEKIKDIFFNKDIQLEIVSIKLSNSDRHNKGKNVYFLTFNDGVELVYKEKDLRVVSRYTQFVNYLIHKYNLDLYYPPGLYEKGFTIERCLSDEEITTRENIPKYFYRFGQLLGLMYILNGKDLHFENVIIKNDYPVPIDLEALIVPLPNKRVETVEQKVLHHIKQSIIQTGLIPDANTIVKDIDTSLFNQNRETQIEIDELQDRMDLRQYSGHIFRESFFETNPLSRMSSFPLNIKWKNVFDIKRKR